jgi:hypothetical protein
LTGTGQANLTFQDTNSGMSTVNFYSANNATVTFPPTFASGTTSPVTATATQRNLSDAGFATMIGTNVAGVYTLCTANFSGSSSTPRQWTGTGGSITGKITVVTNLNGTLQAFARGSDNALWTNTQTSPDGPWGTWTSLGGVLASDPAAARNGNGVVEVFVLGSDSSLWTTVQSSPGGPFAGWRGLGQILTNDPAVTADSSGNLHVFAVGSDQALWTIAETSPGSYGSWTSLGGAVLHNPAVIQNRTACSCRPPQIFIYGSIEVFVVGIDNALWHNWTVDDAFDWSGWSSLGGAIAGSPVAAIENSNGLVSVFGTGTDAALWYTAHPWGSGVWTPFASLGGSLTSDPSAVFDTSDGLVEVFGRGADNALWNITGTLVTPFTFGNWTTLGGVLANGPTAAINQDGRLTAFVEGTDTAVWTIEQPSPGSWQ